MALLPSRVSAVVFDCDGLLLDTEICWSRAEEALFAKFGHDFGPEEKDLLIGRALDDACENAAKYFSIPGQGAEVRAILEPLVLRELESSVEPLPGAIELLESLHGRVPLAVATNSPRAMLDSAFSHVDLAGYFEFSIAADEADRPKPSPELYLRAFLALDADPRCGVAIEDSATGVKAARDSGANVITVPTQTGKNLDGDLLADSLKDERISAWAQSVLSIGGEQM